jgi:hypothetical protein
MDHVFTVASWRHDNVVLQKTSAVSLLITAKRITKHMDKIRIRRSQWRARHTTMWLCRAPATNSTVTACTHARAHTHTHMVLLLTPVISRCNI